MTGFNPIFTITNRMTSAITRIERARGFLEAAKLSDDWVRDMGNQALIKEAHHTTHIEGTRLTLDQAERLWKGETVPEADPEDTRELLNYRSAFGFVSECLDSGDPITEGMIREIHRKLVEGVRGGKADPGNYRRIQNYEALCLEVNRRSLQRDLKTMIEKELIASEGATNQLVYLLKV
jgi:Fic family protein